MVRSGLAIPLLAVLMLDDAVGAPPAKLVQDALAVGWKESSASKPDDHVKLGFWVKLTHTHELKQLLDQVSDPKSPQYGHYLSKAQVDAMTRPTRDHVAAVKSALEGSKVEIEGDGAVISADVSVSFAERLLGGKFRFFCHSSADESNKKICVLRNPTAQVPAALRDACDIISPIDDPFPPVNPLPGPIISNAGAGQSAVMSGFVQAAQPTAGCCFSFGYGAMMIPCCLKTTAVADVTTCNAGKRMGGSSSFSVGQCPASAQDAAALVSKHSGPAAHTALTAKLSQSKPALQTALATHQGGSAGCCYSFGLGAMMKPCCLEATPVSDVASCQADNDRLGGTSGTTLGSCPESAAEAAGLQSRAAAATGLQAKAAAAGCCFSFGFGDMMKPCCLEATSVSDVATCNVGQRMGGASGYSLGKCPANAKEAAEINTKRREHSERASLVVGATAIDSSTAPDNAPSGNYVMMAVGAAACFGLVGVVVAAKRRSSGSGNTALLGDGPGE